MVQALSCKCKCVCVCRIPRRSVSWCLFVFVFIVCWCLFVVLFVLFVCSLCSLFVLFVCYLFIFCKLMYADPIPVISCVPTLYQFVLGYALPINCLYSIKIPDILCRMTCCFVLCVCMCCFVCLL